MSVKCFLDGDSAFLGVPLLTLKVLGVLIPKILIDALGGTLLELYNFTKMSGSREGRFHGLCSFTKLGNELCSARKQL